MSKVITTTVLLGATIACGGQATAEAVRSLAQQPADTAKPTESRPKLYPVDESHLDSSFAEFKSQLLRTLERRDRDGLLKALAAEVVLDFDRPLTQEEVLARFDAQEGQLWREVRHALSLGCTQGADRVSFSAPYVNDLFPEQLEADEFLVITAPDAPVRAEPKWNAPVIAQLSYDIVRWDSSFTPVWETVEGVKHEWRKIVTPQGKTGYVLDEHARSVFDYRASFRKIEGQWKLVSFVAGD